jgi:hypothetical protein
MAAMTVVAQPVVARPVVERPARQPRPARATARAAAPKAAPKKAKSGVEVRAVVKGGRDAYGVFVEGKLKGYAFSSAKAKEIAGRYKAAA